MDVHLFRFQQCGKDEGFDEIARTFDQIAKVEKYHEARYRALIKNITNEEVFSKKTPVKWHCINCGYVYEGDNCSEGLPGL